MGLFGALFAGVSGLDSQSNKIGIISNNIANVNTVGFKQGQANFSTLVVPSGTTSFSPGGVIGGNQQLVNQQGIVSASSSPTDIAITGGGMLFVSATPTTAGTTPAPLFTRAGSFTQDASGNFINSDGYYLLGLPINPTTGQPTSVNVNALQTVNVSSSATGKPTPTGTITLGANFDASQTPLLGPGEVLAPSDSTNAGISANQIIVGNDVPGTNAQGIVRGDSFSIKTPASSNADVFTYGGFTIGRNVASTSNSAETTEALGGGLGDGANVLDTESLAGTSIASSGAGPNANTITVTVNNIADYTMNGQIAISGASALDNIPASEINGEQVVTSVTPTGGGAGLVTFTVATADTGGGANSTSAITVTNRTFNFAGNILDAKSPTDDLLGKSGTAPFTGEALSFSIDVSGVGTTKFTYTSNPDPSAGTFNSLDSLVSAINDATNSGLTAQIQNGRLYISATNPNNQVTFENGDAVGTPNSSPPLSGINWTQELDILPSITPVAGTNYFNSLQSLANAVNTVDPTNLVATVNDPTGNSTLNINEANALQQITFTDGDLTTSALNTGGSLLKELGLSVGLTQIDPKDFTTGALPATYDASNPQKNMSSGAVAPQFTKDITIYDSLGQAHTIAMNVAKIATGEWAVEFTAVPASDVVSSDHSNPSDGQIAAGTVFFNGAGVFQQNPLTVGLESFTINWNQQTVGANPSPVTVELGQSNTTTTSSNGVGLTQAAGPFSVSTADQNGSPTGELTGVSIDSNGFVIASFSNGQTQKMFQLPLANFTNPDGLEAVSGNAYQATLQSGPVNPELAGTSGVGTFTPSALEQSNVDLSTQLTDLIVAQQAYGANSKVLTVSDTLLQELDQIIQ